MVKSYTYTKSWEAWTGTTADVERLLDVFESVASQPGRQPIYSDHPIEIEVTDRYGGEEREEIADAGDGKPFIAAGMQRLKLWATAMVGTTLSVELGPTGPRVYVRGTDEHAVRQALRTLSEVVEERVPWWGKSGFRMIAVPMSAAFGLGAAVLFALARTPLRDLYTADPAIGTGVVMGLLYLMVLGLQKPITTRWLMPFEVVPDHESTSATRGAIWFASAVGIPVMLALLFGG